MKKKIEVLPSPIPVSLQELLENFENSVREHAFIGTHENAEIRTSIEETYQKAKNELIKTLNNYQIALDGICAWSFLLHRFGPETPEGKAALKRIKGEM